MCIGSSPKQATPVIQEDASQAAAKVTGAQAQAKKRMGYQSTMLTGGNGGSAAATRKSSLLGGSPM